MQNRLHCSSTLIPLSLLGNCFHLVSTSSLCKILFCPSPRAVQEWQHSGSFLVLTVSNSLFKLSIILARWKFYMRCPASGKRVSVSFQLLPTTLLRASTYLGCTYLSIVESLRLEGNSEDCPKSSMAGFSGLCPAGFWIFSKDRDKLPGLTGCMFSHLHIT